MIIRTDDINEAIATYEYRMSNGYVSQKDRLPKIIETAEMNGHPVLTFVHTNYGDYLVEFMTNPSNESFARVEQTYFVPDKVKEILYDT